MSATPNITFRHHRWLEAAALLALAVSQGASAETIKRNASTHLRQLLE